MFDKLEGNLLCKPSPIHTDYEMMFIYDKRIWSEYANAIKTLIIINKFTKLPCLPTNKIIDKDNMVIGLLLNSHYYLPLSPTLNTMNKEDGLKTITLSSLKGKILGGYTPGMEETEYHTTLPTNDFSEVFDQQRMDNIENINMEHTFYNAFRNSIRMMFSHYNNMTHIQEIKETIKK